jgi:spermidine synthase
MAIHLGRDKAVDRFRLGSGQGRNPKLSFLGFLEVFLCVLGEGFVKPAELQTEARIASRPVLSVLFFCSGSLALIYEVIWQRGFALVFGSSGPATAAVLAAYFAGLGLGSQIIGSRTARLKRPLLVYSILELFIGLSALLVPLILLAFEKSYPWLFARFGGSPFLFVMIKTALAFVCLFAPTFCMGGTLPVLAQLVDSGGTRLGLTAGWLYVVNTAGAALGALSVPFILLPRFGANRTLWLAAGGNLLVALLAWRISVGSSLSVVVAKNREDEQIESSWWEPALFFSFLSGLSTFALQVLWNRAFAQVHENSIYSFAIIVAVFIFALAIGAQLARVCLKVRPLSSNVWLGSSWLAGGALTLLSPWLFLRLTNGLAYLAGGTDWEHYITKLVLLAFCILFVPITLLGLALPLLMEKPKRDGDAGRAIGKLLAANILGSVIGALLAGFLLPQALGLWNSIFLIGTMLLIAGSWQFLKDAQTRWIFRAGALIIGSLVFWACARAGLPRVKVAQSQGEHLMELWEGTHGIVAVVGRPQSIRLKLNNYYTLGGTSSIGDERMQAHIPLLLHPNPRRVAFLGLGTGITAGGALFHPIHDITIVELAPEVAAAALSFFGQENRNVLFGKSRIFIDDARSFLRGSNEKFDVLIGDLVVPWREGEGALFTLEHFAAAKARLAPGGLFCVWLPCFQLSDNDLTILARTFLSVFPEAYVWRGDFSPIAPAVALIGAVEPFQLDPATIKARLSQFPPDPANPQLRDAISLWMQFIGILRPEDLPADDPRMNRQDRPWIELSGPKEHAGSDTSRLLIGRRLEAWENEIQTRRSGLAQPEPEAEAGMKAGNLLYEFTLLLSEKRETEARAVREKLKGLLPGALFESLLPEE